MNNSPNPEIFRVATPNDFLSCRGRLNHLTGCAGRKEVGETVAPARGFGPAKPGIEHLPMYVAEEKTHILIVN